MSVQKAALRERTREIARVFIRHGFGFLLRDLDWRQVGKGEEGLLVAKDFYTDAQQEKIRTMSQRLPLMLEELGPTFIKFGQFLSSRPDLLPEFLLEALERLHEQVAPIPFAEVEAALDANLPSWRQDFLRVEPEPLGMGGGWWWGVVSCTPLLNSQPSFAHACQTHHPLPGRDRRPCRQRRQLC